MIKYVIIYSSIMKITFTFIFIFYFEGNFYKGENYIIPRKEVKSYIWY